ncbi:MAG: orotidine-5'-phosphate decarboxylase [Alcanivorax sp.]|nr:orotidine-5'-phosphate decarboxylase [Alcanivorax sp.]
MPVNTPIIVALDFPTADAALAMADRLDPRRVRAKVGKELFTRSGPAVIEALHQRGFEVFLDLKFHDIPNTVAGAVKSAAELGVWMTNVHASGGRRMLEAAANAIANHAQRPLLTAVTVLTSMGAEDLAEIGISASPEEQVLRLARLTRDSGLDGVVCSAREATLLRDACGADFRLVTPGIRPAGADAGDQTRVVTPADAMAMGVNDMVMGRPITQADDPAAAVERILASLPGMADR